MDKDDLGIWLEIEVFNSEGNAAFNTEARSVVLLPEIASISPSTGSTNGGTEVTITGAGLTVDDVYVLLDYSEECEITEVVDFFTAVCMTSTPTNSYPEIPSNKTQIVTVTSGSKTLSQSTFIFTLPEEGISFTTEKALTAVVQNISQSDSRLEQGTEFTFTIENLQGSSPEVFLGNAKCSETDRQGEDFTCVLDETPTTSSWFVQMTVMDSTGYRVGFLLQLTDFGAKCRISGGNGCLRSFLVIFWSFWGQKCHLQNTHKPHKQKPPCMLL